MRFLVDAQLPRALARLLEERGHDAIHTLDLPRGNRSGDREIAVRADAENRIVVSKDSDFLALHHGSGSPRRLLLISTGNMINPLLFTLVDRYLASTERAFVEADLVEMREHLLVIHSRVDEPPRDEP